MANCAIVGVNWGDEGKGRMVDLLAEQYDVVVRYQGGNNAGHTVINQYGKFALHLIPSGIFTPGVINVLGNGTVVDVQSLWEEIESLQKSGVSVTPENFKISDRATLVMPYHRDLDELEEQRLGDAKFGSTKRGIAPVYSDKYQKKTIMAGELLYPAYLRKRLAGIVEWKNLTLSEVYHAKPYTLDGLMEYLENYGSRLAPFICDAGAVLRSAQAAGKRILFEAQLGALRDLDYGIYPYTSSSSPLASYAPVGCGMPEVKVDEVLGIVKAYSTCVGEGPFTAEWFGAEADKLREAGGEYGASTGRPRRVGPFDVVATRYGAQVQGATAIALTKMDILSYMNKIPVCAQYEVNGVRTDAFPFTALINEAKPVIEYMEGWGCDISGIREYAKLPQAARDYVEYIESALNCPVRYVSVGAARDAIIVR